MLMSGKAKTESPVAMKSSKLEFVQISRLLWHCANEGIGIWCEHHKSWSHQKMEPLCLG